MYTRTTEIMLAVMFLAVYAYSAICFSRISRGLGVGRPWYAWVPVLNVYLVCRIAGKRYLWTVLAFIPIVNIVIFIMLCFKVSRACGSGRLIGLLLIVPVVDLVALWVLVVRIENRSDGAHTAAEAGAALPG